VSGTLSLDGGITWIHADTTPVRVAPNTQVQLTTTAPDADHVFVNWTSLPAATFGTPTLTTTTFTMPTVAATETVTVTANWQFVEPQHPLLTVMYGTFSLDGITWVPANTPVRVEPGTSVQLATTAPTVDHVFVNWTSTHDEDTAFGSRTATTTTFEMPDADVTETVTVTANWQFVEPEHPLLTVIYGTFTVDGGAPTTSARVAPGTEVELTTTAPTADHVFVNWTSTHDENTAFGSRTATTTTFEMPDADVTETVTVTANWRAEFGITVIRGTADLDRAYAGAIVTVTLDPDTAPAEFFDYAVFDRWTSVPTVPFTDLGTDPASATFVMPNQAIEVTAHWRDSRLELHDITVIGGFADRDTAFVGAEVIVTVDPTAAPSANHVFDGWVSVPVVTFNDLGTSPESAMFIMPDEAIEVTATWRDITAPVYRTLIVEDGTFLHNNVQVNSGQIQVGATVMITAGTPPANEQFYRWVSLHAADGDFGNVEAAATTFTMPAGDADDDVIVTATWEQIGGPEFRTLTVVGGTFLLNGAEVTSGEVEIGTQVRLTAVAPSADHNFVEWTSLSGTIANHLVQVTDFTMPNEAVTVTAHWSLPGQLHAITVIGGTSSVTSAAMDAVVTVYTTSPGEGYVFTGWTSFDVTFADATSTQTTFVMINRAVTVTANWEFEGQTGTLIGTIGHITGGDDINNDDVFAATLYVAGFGHFIGAMLDLEDDEFDIRLADIDGDGEITNDDVFALTLYVAGFKSFLPAMLGEAGQNAYDRIGAYQLFEPTV
jgi:uncharacterized repeat protein (TIGR02543 family)